ncbi:(2Fe-2S)-binding protein [Streptosporangium fragile]|uniref:(2Fe-2S)-binding protein n=1 Tax=Streptosporangium fragile TaxID=46186 RepID=A0ABP6IAZ6_9ACTN
MTDPAKTVTLRVNGSAETFDVEPSEPLVRTLRERLGLHSVRTTCGIGVCGSCTVIFDGKPVSGCLMLTAMADGGTIVTAEGLDGTEAGAAVQEAFIDHHAFQCSFCIPAMTLAAHALLEEHPEADDDTIREYLSGNLCRCGTYPQILDAVGSLCGRAGACASGEGGCA